MKLRNNKIIAILGGMGPDASARLYQLMIHIARDQFGARDNHEYPEIVIYSVPIPDFIANQELIGVAKKMLIQRVKQLAHLSPAYMAIACNTVHVMLNDLQTHAAAKFISMPEEAVKQTAVLGYSKVCLLATPSTIKFKIYQHLLDQYGIRYNYPLNADLIRLGNIISRLVQGKTKGTARQLAVLTNFYSRDCQAILLGCTELPLVFPLTCALPVIDSTQILAESILKRYYNKERYD